MIDFATFATAAESSFGLPAGATVCAMMDRQRGVAEDAVSDNALAQAILKLAEDGGFVGTAKALIESLGPNKDWTKSPRGFRSQLNAVIPNLEKLGLSINHEQGRSNSTIWTIPNKATSGSSVGIVELAVSSEATTSLPANEFEQVCKA